MPNPFTIHIYSCSEDPHSIRIVNKSNWSGIGYVFPKEMINEVTKEKDSNLTGVYILVGDLADETIYIGEADQIATRLKQHQGKDWSWGVFFVDSHGLGKTEAQYLESELVRIASEIGRATLENGNNPQKPTMTRQSEAAAKAFLKEMIPIFPMLGIQAFTPIKDSAKKSKQKGGVKADDEPRNEDDTIVVPAKKDGFDEVFIGKNCWYAIRIDAQNVSRIKYIAAYQVAPISAVTHVAEVADIEPYMDSGKYMVRFRKAAKKLNRPIRMQKSKQGSQPQAPRYTSMTKIIKSKYLHQLWSTSQIKIPTKGKRKAADKNSTNGGRKTLNSNKKRQ